MPRFGTKTLLFAFVLVALWFSTFSGYAAGRDVRASVLLVLFLTAGYAAVYGRGRMRAFWAGFFTVMLLMGGNFFQGPVNKFLPDFSWRAPQIGPLYPVGAPVISYAYPPSPQPYNPAYPSDPVPATALPKATLIPAQVTRNHQFALAAEASIDALWMLSMACIIGLIGAWLYSSIGQKDDPS